MKVAPNALEAIREHGEEGYPHEICGIMLGPRGEGWVSEVRRARNIIEERARDRYEIDPPHHIRIQKEAAAAPLDILAYYHSPPHPPAPAPRLDTHPPC